MAEIFLQDLEQNRIKHLLEDEKVIYYNRYVDDIFIIYNQTRITPQNLFEQFNAQHKNLQFTINEEINNQIAHLDVNLINKRGQLGMKILVYRKPTATDITINSNSCNPKEHKLGPYKNGIQRLFALPLNENNKKKELNTIINVALNNGYRKEDIIHIHNKLKQRQNKPENNAKKEQKWVTFTYTYT
jgi:hypothetical protein